MSLDTRAVLYDVEPKDSIKTKCGRSRLSDETERQLSCDSTYIVSLDMIVLMASLLFGGCDMLYYALKFELFRWLSLFKRLIARSESVSRKLLVLLVLKGCERSSHETKNNINWVLKISIFKWFA